MFGGPLPKIVRLEIKHLILATLATPHRREAVFGSEMSVKPNAGPSSFWTPAFPMFACTDGLTQCGHDRLQNSSLSYFDHGITFSL